MAKIRCFFLFGASYKRKNIPQCGETVKTEGILPTRWVERHDYIYKWSEITLIK